KHVEHQHERVEPAQRVQGGGGEPRVRLVLAEERMSAAHDVLRLGKGSPAELSDDAGEVEAAPAAVGDREERYAQAGIGFERLPEDAVGMPPLRQHLSRMPERELDEEALAFGPQGPEA